MIDPLLEARANEVAGLTIGKAIEIACVVPDNTTPEQLRNIASRIASKVREKYGWNATTRVVFTFGAIRGMYLYSV